MHGVSAPNPHSDPLLARRGPLLRGARQAGCLRFWQYAKTQAWGQVHPFAGASEEPLSHCVP
eukprot:491575-Alexandrium_andersonii.AAC.1